MTARTNVAAALAALVASTFAGSAMAEDRTFLTPPLYREQARVTATVRPAAELTTVPNAISRAPEGRRVLAEAGEPAAR